MKRKREGKEGKGRGGEVERGGKRKTNVQLIAMITGLQNDSPVNYTSVFSLPSVVPSHSKFELAPCKQKNVPGIILCDFYSQLI